MQDYYSISKVCGSLASLQALIFADMTNVSNYGPGSLPPAPGNPPAFTDTDKVYSIAFEKFTGELTKDSTTDGGGDYEIHRATVFVPRSRSEVEILLQRMRNRFLLVIGIDRHGNQHILYNARRVFKHSTGARPGSRHGYEISFTAPSDYLLPSIAGNGDIDTAPPEPPVEGGGEEEENDCCLTIEPVKIDYTPTPTGNLLNLNKLVTTENDTIFFIDKNGRSLIINRPAPRYYRVNLGVGLTLTSIILPEDFPIPDPADYPLPVYDTNREIAVRFVVHYGNRWLLYDHAQGFGLDVGTHAATFPDGVTSGIIEFYSYVGIPPRPL